MVIDDLMYKHWDEWVKTIPHCFVAKFENNKIDNYIDIIGDNEPFECPMKPFGGIEQTAWSPDSKTIAYTCRKKTGLKYSISTDSDIFLYNTEDKTTVNICKPNGYEEPEIDPTLSMKNQKVNKQTADLNLGYDTNPAFSPDGKYLAWQSMKNNGYESDRNRICLYNIATGEKAYITDSFDSNAESFCWSSDGKSVFFTGIWHGTIQVYNATLTGKIKQITSGQYDYNTIMTSGSNIVCTRQSMKQPTEIYLLNTKKGTTKALTSENKWFYDNIDWGEVEPRWTKTTDGKNMLTWVVFPPNFDKTKKYPALLFCEGGPQSPVSQFWSYRWNMQIMAANGYIVVAPNRRGLPGFGSEWNEEISTNYGGQCMNDYLSAIDDISKEPYVDADRMGCVGASFGGFSVYYLAGNHNKRFKCFIAHDGIYNLEQQYLETEELWFTNWDLGGAPWHKDIPEVKRSYAASPHLFVDKWDTPILCIHGEKDYRIVASQAMSAFNAAKLRGVPAELLIYPDENHWVLKPQNGVLWQRTFFNWLDRWLKN
jgi:dipeptidyl aminopeptidase/acylaminoacyl peptidase